jgi:proteasome lid subunit RPN8/RPN11
MDVNPMTDDGEKIDTPEAVENRKIGQRYGSPPTPHLLVFVERELKHNIEGYLGSQEFYEQLLKDVIDDASTSGAVRGGLAGLHLGLGSGPLGWLATIVLAPVALTAGLFGLVFGALLGKEKGTKELSKERIEKVTAFAEGKVTSAELDHGLSVDIVDYWVDNRQKYQLSIYQRQVLIKNLMKGFTGDAEERAIIKILENSTDPEILQIFSQREEDAPNLLELADEFQGEEREYLDQLLLRLRERFPVKPALQKTTGLLIDNSFVRSTMADSFRATHHQEPGKPAVQRECTGVFVAPKQGGSMEKETACEDVSSAGTGELARAALKKRGKGFEVLGSYHTHPVAYPPTAREAPSGADIKTFWQNPAEGKEHYVVGPLVTYLILRKDGTVRPLGNTADLLQVERIEPKAGQVSTLELG